MTKDIHGIQGEIIKGLLHSKTARFSDLKPTDVPSDQFTFHIKKMVDEGVVQKTEDGAYELTISGKDYANRFDTDSGPVKHEKQAKITVLVIASRGTGEHKEYVMQTRLKHPFYGFRGFITGKIKLGESVLEAAARELKEETGLEGDIVHKSVYHERLYSESGECVEDKYFFICTAEAKGELIGEFEGGKNAWVPVRDAIAETNFYDIADLLARIAPGAAVFSEKAYTVHGY